MSSIKALAAIASASGAAGFGYSAGRSLWKGIQRNAAPVIFLSFLFIGSGLAAFYLRMGHRWSYLGKLLLVIFPAMLVIVASILLVFFVASVFKSVNFLYIGLSLQAIAFIGGILIAQPVREQRELRWEVEAHNEAFLRNIGFRDVGGSEDTWLDDEDRELVVHDSRSDAIIFRIKDKRGGRSKILLDPDGRMFDYIRG